MGCSHRSNILRMNDMKSWGNLETRLPDYGEFLSKFLEKYDVLFSERVIDAILNAKRVVNSYIDEETQTLELPKNYLSFLSAKGW